MDNVNGMLYLSSGAFIMMDFIEAFLSALITGVTVFIGSYLMMKLTIRQAKNDIKETIEIWINSEKGQLALKELGKLIMGGAAGNLKQVMPHFKTQDLIGLAVLAFLKKSGMLEQVFPQAAQIVPELPQG